MFTWKGLLGDHNVCFYESNRERQNLLFSNLKAGLGQGCSGLYIASEETIEPVQLEMRKFGLNTEDHKKLRSVTSYQFYAPDGEFRVNRAIEQIRSSLDESLDKGFEGLYISTDVSNFFNYMTKNGMTEKWFTYEKALGRKFSLPISGLCGYKINQIESNDELFLQLIQTHQNTVNTKKLDFVNNEKICNTTITEELDRILGSNATELIFRFLEKRLKMSRNQILANIVEFNQGLEQILGDGAMSIEKHILKQLQKKIELTNTSVEI